MNTNVAGTVEISLSTNWKKVGAANLAIFEEFPACLENVSGCWKSVPNNSQAPNPSTVPAVASQCRPRPGTVRSPSSDDEAKTLKLLASCRRTSAAAATLVLAAAALPKISRCRWFGSFELFGCFSAVSDNHRPSLLSRKDLASYILFKLGQLNCKW